MSVTYIPVVSEEEYHLFRDIGFMSEFPINYSTFLELIDKEIKEGTNADIPVLKVNIDFSGFVKWFNSARYATFSDLLNYSVFVAKSK